MPREKRYLEELRQNLWREALKLTGVPYQFGASPESAPRIFDCSSFVQYLYDKVANIKLPRSSILQADCGREVNHDDLAHLEIGDLLFSRGTRGYYNDEVFKRKLYIGHVAMYIGNGEYIEASGKRGCVRIGKLDEIDDYDSINTIQIAKRILF